MKLFSTCRQAGRIDGPFCDPPLQRTYVFELKTRIVQAGRVGCPVYTVELAV